MTTPQGQFVVPRLGLLVINMHTKFEVFNISLARLHQHSGILLLLIHNIGHWKLPKIWVGTFLVRNVQLRGKTLN